MFFTPSFETAKPTREDRQKKRAYRARSKKSFTVRADRDFERFITQHGPFRTYLPYPL